MLSYCTQKTTDIIVCHHCYLRCTIIYFILTNHWLSYDYVVVLYTEDHGHYSMPSLLFKVYYYLLVTRSCLYGLSYIENASKRKNILIVAFIGIHTWSWISTGHYFHILKLINTCKRVKIKRLSRSKKASNINFTWILTDFP
jgi:hypothetical protein